jgi:hypothetical protein
MSEVLDYSPELACAGTGWGRRRLLFPAVVPELRDLLSRYAQPGRMIPGDLARYWPTGRIRRLLGTVDEALTCESG